MNTMCWVQNRYLHANIHNFTYTISYTGGYNKYPTALLDIFCF